MKIKYKFSITIVKKRLLGINNNTNNVNNINNNNNNNDNNNKLVVKNTDKYEMIIWDNLNFCLKYVYLRRTCNKCNCLTLGSANDTETFRDVSLTNNLILHAKRNEVGS